MSLKPAAAQPEVFAVQLIVIYNKKGICAQVITPLFHTLPEIILNGQTSIIAYVVVDGKVKGSSTPPIGASMGILGGGGPGEIPSPFFLTVNANEAVGYSPNLSFEEAFNAASTSLLKNIPTTYPDQMIRLKVVEIGREYGGFAGVSQTFVRVRRENNANK